MVIKMMIINKRTDVKWFRAFIVFFSFMATILQNNTKLTKQLIHLLLLEEKECVSSEP